jgi:outer membrane protein OmpA-like peptidoglycan-associated protein
MGGLDIFVSHGEKGNWTAPKNLQYPINSPKDDFSPCIIEPGFKGYISSNRDGGKGGDDIYYFSKEFVIAGVTKAKLLNNKIEILEDVTLTIENLVDDHSSTIESGEKGKFDFPAEYKKSYQIKAVKDGYFSASIVVNTDLPADKDTLFVELVLDKIEVSKSFVLENIYYDFDKWNIRPDAAIELDKLVKILKEYPEIDVELGSHTDSRGSDSYNLKLSQRRAESAVAYIISMGIDESRISAKGYGETKLRNHCIEGQACTDLEHQLNRRTEFTITKIRAKSLSLNK